MPHIYILRCADDSFYVGSTWNLERRLAQHQRGEGAQYTRHRLPVELVYCEWSESMTDAYTREKQVQGWGRAKRIALIEGRLTDLPGLSKKAAPPLVEPVETTPALVEPVETTPPRD